MALTGLRQVSYELRLRSANPRRSRDAERAPLVLSVFFISSVNTAHFYRIINTKKLLLLEIITETSTALSIHHQPLLSEYLLIIVSDFRFSLV